MNEAASNQGVLSDTAAHVSEARTRAQSMLGGEPHIGPVDDWRQALVRARDVVVLVVLVWLTLEGLGRRELAGAMMPAFGLGASLLLAISAARAVLMHVEYCASEFERERREIQEDFEHERGEVRALYEAKGFRDPLLTQVVDVLCADDDRLLKVMMEEELDLSMHHVNHPLAVGLWNFGVMGAFVAAMWLPVVIRDGGSFALVGIWGGLLLAAASYLAARTSGRKFLPLLVSGLIMAVAAGGTAYYLARWLASVP